MPKEAGESRSRFAVLIAVALLFGLVGIPAAGAATVPSAPRTLVVVAGPGSGAVALSWVAPLQAGSSPISNYGFSKSTDGGVTYSAIAYFGSTALSARSSSF